MEVKIVPAENFRDGVLRRFFPPKGQLPGHSMGWEKTKGVRVLPAELSIWTGINGHGKSLLLNEVVLHSGTQGVKTGIASFEMKPEATLHRMVQQACATYRLTRQEVVDCLRWLSEFVFVYDLVGTADPKTMIRTFQVAVETMGITQFVVDSMMKCGLAEDDYNGQKRLVEDLSNFALKTDSHVHLVAHARKGKDETEVPGKFDVLGASGITNIAHNVYSVWRNKPKELKLQACEFRGEIPSNELVEFPDVFLSCEKHREFGGDVEGRYAFWFHREGRRYLEHYGDTAQPLFAPCELPYV